MNKTDTIDHIARSADLSKDAAGRVMDAFDARLKAHTAEGKRVVFRGFGSFSRGLPAQKTGRNPRTGQPITYSAYHKPGSAPAVGEATLRNEIAADAQVVSPKPVARSCTRSSSAPHARTRWPSQSTCLLPPAGSGVRS